MPQKIDTAPRDGTTFVGLDLTHRKARHTRYVKLGDYGFFESDGTTWQPTHWISFPNYES